MACHVVCMSNTVRYHAGSACADLPPIYLPPACLLQVTLLASAVAFALGAVTNLNSVRWFSVHATMNTVMILVLMVRGYRGWVGGWWVCCSWDGRLGMLV